jgi:ABC-type Mn2+/Zn2+ transport system permease subunit
MHMGIDLLSLAPLAVTAVAAGLVGTFAIVRRMALASDALSHVALPGIGVALALQIHPLVGAAAMLAFGALIVWALEETTRAATETVIGVLFSAALAVGSLITSGDALIDALFGGPGARHRLIIALISPDIARTAGVDVRRLNLLFLQVFAMTIALGLRYLGVLLMGSLLIIPAATARRFSTNLSQMLVWSAGLALVSAVTGAVLAGWLQRETGPVVVAIASALFVISLAKRPA